MEKTVFIIDDSALARRTIKNLLENDGFDVVGETDGGANAINQYKELKPNIVTIDIAMSKMDGFRALEDILDYNPEAKVVVITGKAKEEVVKKTVGIGAKYFIAKPFEGNELVEIVEKVFNDEVAF
ncbi:response regulator [Clostridium felsineum]|uniref:response regulator n=1 Tax=Clostridium felsineum TaxID=36839 RepID=UPI00098CA77C|nr:response regulator [Clostridium felsineum]MCR3758975.1 response regulator [Clostridium felsineum]URZ02665.1 Chemotaxis protein CheY [Clostridium felsineum]URZ18445.1 Chemotaxis protein CheY [Clostridium felsineum DSM 794]